MSESVFDPYVVLGVDRSASPDQIEIAYRRAAAKAHPDREGGSTEAMTDVNMAWKILSDPIMKERFDSGKGYGTLPPLDIKARSLLISLLQIAVRNSGPFDPLIEILRQQVLKQQEGLKDCRKKSLNDLSLLRLRLTQLRGPKDNFIESYILNEIEKGEALLPTLDTDEQVQVRALELLKDFSYGPMVQPQMFVSAASDPTNLFRVLTSPSG